MGYYLNKLIQFIILSLYITSAFANVNIRRMAITCNQGEQQCIAECQCGSGYKMCSNNQWLTFNSVGIEN